MSARREEAQRAAAARGRAREAEAQAGAREAAAEARSGAVASEHAREVMACLRELGFRAGEARPAVEFCETLPDATLEARVRAALKFLSPRPRHHDRDGTSQAARV